MSKGQIIHEGFKLNVNFSDTTSCYDPSEDGIACGDCLACLVRKDAFLSNDLTDPIQYKK
jgi:7-cyano-7-deazaguanine synthase